MNRAEAKAEIKQRRAFYRGLYSGLDADAFKTIYKHASKTGFTAFERARQTKGLVEKYAGSRASKTRKTGRTRSGGGQ